jgi:diguanylate cyclase (GGDEF)-like protein/putative nucleotidyltransferase with HDIG domain
MTSINPPLVHPDAPKTGRAAVEPSPAVRALIVFGLGLVVLYVLRAPIRWGGTAVDNFFLVWVYGAAALVGTVLCAWRAIRVHVDRVVWSLIALSLVFQVAGNTVYSTLYSAAPVVPLPSVADGLWIACYLPMTAALVLRIRRAGGGGGVVVLDVLIAIGALGSISAAFVVDAIIGGGSGPAMALVTSLAYPVCDLVLVALVLRLAAASGWRLGRATTVLAGCFVTWAVADTLYAFQTVHETYVAGGVLDLGWVGPFVLFGLAAWMRPDPVTARESPGWRALAVPVGFSVIALVMVVYCATADVTFVPIAFATGSLVCVIARFVLTFRSYLVVLGQTEDEAMTDALTGLPNRRALTADLEAAVAGGEDAQLLLFDLNGFKGYNDAFGHPAGDALLQRLGGCLRHAVGTAGTAYRMGGDEFCLLLGPDGSERTVSRACAALCEHGEGFAISVAHGRVAIPTEATNPAQALRIADQRMYRDKRSTRAPAGEQATHVLLRVLSERHPDVGDHSEGVAELAEAVARELDVEADLEREVRAGAELHDIGKAAIPDAILNKPGPLDEDEWAFMRRHTLIGERIVASADALSSVAKLVRSSHERWDGEGYPDGLAGDAIPLGARIISVCDAFDAMLAERPYSAALDIDDATAELRRSAGRQFDPRVVAAFLSVLHRRSAHPLAATPDAAQITPG